MVDINLIGNEKSEPSQDKEKSFSDTASYSTDNFASSDIGGLSSNPHDSDSYMDSSYAKKSPKTLMYVLIGGCCVLLVLLILLLVSDSDKKVDEIAEGVSDKAQTTDLAKASKPLALGINEDKVVNVNRLLSILPGGLKLSVMRYSHGNFIIESRSNSKDPIADFRTQFRQAFPGGTIKEVNTESKRIRGKSFQQGVVSGVVHESNIWNRADQLAQLTYISEKEIRAKVTSSCERYGLKVKNVGIGKGSAENNFRVNLVKVSAVGKKDAAIRFLESLNEQKLNLNISKIVMVTSNFQNINDDKISLFVDMELFTRL